MDTDDWHFPRNALAKQFLDDFARLGARALALFAERGIGKTEFLQKDLAPAAKEAGAIPVYVDVWRVREDPAQGIANALKNAALAIHTPGFFKRLSGKMNIDFLGHGGAAVSINEAKIDADAREPSGELARLGYWLDRLASGAGRRPVLLMMDEVQELGVDKNGANIAAALRGGFQTNMGKFLPVFTGSSRDRLELMFTDNRAPLYQYGDRLDFPKLGPEFVDHVAKRFHKATKGLDFNREQAYLAFEALGCKPGLFIGVIRSMARERTTNLETGFGAAFAKEHDQNAMTLRMSRLTPLDLQVLHAIAQGQQPFSQESLQKYADAIGTLIAKPAVQRSIDKLRADELVITGVQRREWLIADSQIVSYLNKKQLGHDK